MACLSESFCFAFNFEVTDNNCLREKKKNTQACRKQRQTNLPLGWFYHELHQAVLAMARDDKVAFLASLNVTEHSARFKMTTFAFLKFFRDTMKSSEMPVQPFITPHVSNALLLNHLPPKMDTLFFPPNGLQNKIFFSLHFTFLWIFLASIIFWQRG